MKLKNIDYQLKRLKQIESEIHMLKEEKSLLQLSTFGAREGDTLTLESLYKVLEVLLVEED